MHHCEGQNKDVAGDDEQNLNYRWPYIISKTAFEQILICKAA